MHSTLETLVYNCFMSRIKEKKAFHVVTLIIIWRMRNEVEFKRTSNSASKVIEEVKTLGFLWIKNRSKEASIT
ncbi:hypothetical protein Hanom_Chr14g01332131 [Helianthus anomalus]